MRTAEFWNEEWCKAIRRDQGLMLPATRLEVIKAIQADARRAGLMEAAAIARELNDGHDWPVTRAIERAAESSGK